MATTKIWPVRDNLKRLVDYAGNPAKTEYADLQQALHYAANEAKTSLTGEKLYLVSGVNCDSEKAFEQMTAVKRHFGKTGGNVAYHAYQSFRPGEVTPEQCHELGVKLAERLWGDRYQVLVATHLDREHLHNHLLVNSVSFIDGRKFNDNKACYMELRNTSDALCREYGLSVIESAKGHTPRSIYFAEKQGEPTKYNLMREAIDLALENTSTVKDFVVRMRELGYELNLDPGRKYPTIRAKNSEKAVRLYRLGEKYDFPAIEEKLYDNRYEYSAWMFEVYKDKRRKRAPAPQKYRLHGSLQRQQSLPGLYVLICYMLGIFPKEKQHRPLSPEMREECRRLDSYCRQSVLVVTKHLNTVDDVKSFLSDTDRQMQELIHLRNLCYNRLRRCTDPEEIAEIRNSRNLLTKQIAIDRRDLQTANEVLERSERLPAMIQRELTMRREKQKREYLPPRRQKQLDWSYER